MTTTNAAPDPSIVAPVLDDPAGDPQLVALYRGESQRLEEATPAGAALIASMRWALGSRKVADARAVVDAWVAARGLEFAAAAEEQTITEVWVTSLPEVELWQEEKDRVPLGTLDAVTASEVLRDLTTLTSSGGGP